MQLSMWTGYLDQLSVYDAVREFANKNWHTLEISNEHAHELLHEGRDHFKTGREFRDYANDLGVSFPQGHFYLTKSYRVTTSGLREGVEWADIAPPTQPEIQAVLDDMKKWMDLFAGLDVKAGVIHAGGTMLPSLGWSDGRMLEHRAGSLRQIAQMAEGTGVMICIENVPHDRSGAQTATEIRELIETAGGVNLSICLDTGHANMIGIDAAGFVDESADLLMALHVTDNLGQEDDHILPYSHGTVDWTRFVAALKRTGYDGLFNFEIPGETRAYPGHKTERYPKEILLRKLDYMRSLGEWMIE